MGAAYGYTFYFSDGGDVLTFPITPGELTISVGSNNKVVTLINEGDINILKSPSLVEVEFEARFPMRKYPYSRQFQDFQSYFDKFKELKEEKKSFRFIVARETVAGSRTWDTNLLVALEEFEITEDADEGDDVLINFKLKQYKAYGVKKLQSSNTTTSTAPRARDTSNSPGQKTTTYTVKEGDTLWGIAKENYGDGSLHTEIYNDNKETIEYDAKEIGKRKSSSNGHWIYPGTKIRLAKTQTFKDAILSERETGVTTISNAKGGSPLNNVVSQKK